MGIEEYGDKDFKDILYYTSGELSQTGLTQDQEKKSAMKYINYLPDSRLSE